MNKILLKHYLSYICIYKEIPKMFNPYNESEIKLITPTLTTNCGHFDSSAAVLIYEEDKKKK